MMNLLRGLCYINTLKKISKSNSILDITLEGDQFENVFIVKVVGLICIVKHSDSYLEVEDVEYCDDGSVITETITNTGFADIEEYVFIPDIISFSVKSINTYNVEEERNKLNKLI